MRPGQIWCRVQELEKRVGRAIMGQIPAALARYHETGVRVDEPLFDSHIRMLNASQELIDCSIGVEDHVYNEALADYDEAVANFEQVCGNYGLI